MNTENASADEMLIKLVCAHICLPRDAAWFMTTWRQLADAGQCDDFDGMECRRVIGEWACASCPINPKFLVERANIGPVNKGECEDGVEHTWTRCDNPSNPGLMVCKVCSAEKGPTADTELSRAEQLGSAEQLGDPARARTSLSQLEDNLNP